MNKPQVILCDLDGTVANCEHRKRYIDDVIRVGDTVYPKAVPDAKRNKGTVTRCYELESGRLAYDVDHTGKPWPGYGHSHLRKKKDYKRFFESCKDDSPLQTTIDVVKLLSSKYPIVYCSGRPDDYRPETEVWLNQQRLWFLEASLTGSHPFAPAKLLMRQSGDQRQDYIVKEELYRKHIEPFYTVKCVFDDRAQVVSMWRRLGLTCYAVAEGNF